MSFRRRASKIKYDFYGQYKDNVIKIMQARDLLSDTHGIKLAEAKNEWIDKQLSTERTEAAQDLLINTRYITFNILFSSMRELIAYIYAPLIEKIKSGQLAVISLYAGQPNTDTYFMAVVAVYFIRLLGYPDPSIIYHITRLGAIPNEAIIYLNDISYYGKEIADLLALIKKQNRDTIFTVGLIVTTEATLNYVKTLPLTFHYVHYIPSIKTLVGETRFLRMCYYFAPGTEDSIQVSVYFDHSLGNSSFTFIRALILGPILPTELNYSPLNKHNMYTLIAGITNHPGKIKPTFEEQDSLVVYDEEFKSYIPEINALVAQDNKLKEREENIITQIQFHPLIANCDLPPLEEYVDWSYYDLMAEHYVNIGHHAKDRTKLNFLLENIKPFYKNPAYTLK